MAAVLTLVFAAAVTPPDPFSPASTLAAALPVLIGVAVRYTYRDVLTASL